MPPKAAVTASKEVEEARAKMKARFDAVRTGG
eukprot:CAMPEP_0172707250 /NCGR_PEP_ID=MMETSP1074-20121228/49026_1 /TAXON_ID=2916 /ORGANISM="Ceratium fusus, Strain PA161109" /LENGTH=31 /DNA_ID= /DNA_START= /DNA_END= /DNA_ORIENTATION=